MLLRRITEHVKAQNWTAVGLDFFIVVVGVFLGIQVANWNDGQAEQQEERLLMSRLASDFETIALLLDDQMSDYHENMIATSALVGFAAGEAEMETSALKAALGRTLSLRIPPRRSATFAEMVASGKVEFIREERLRRALIVYDDQAEVTRDAFEYAVDLQREFVGPLFQTARFKTDPADASFETINEVKSVDVDAFQSNGAMLTSMQAFYRIHENMYLLLGLNRSAVQEIRELLAAVETE